MRAFASYESVYHRTMSATTNVTSHKKRIVFPIDVGKSLRVMNLNKGQIIVKNLDPGDERVELSSSSSQLNAKKAENFLRVYFYYYE